MKAIKLVAILFAALSLTAAAGDLPALSHGLTAHAAKKPAPPLKLKGIDGQVHDIAALRGKVILVNFWATWCPPCRREMPSMEHLARKLRGENFAVLAVDVGENVDTIETFISQLELDLTFPILLDTSSKAMQAWKVSGLPTTFVIDRKGHIAYSAIGGREFDHPEIEQKLRDLLKN